MNETLEVTVWAIPKEVQLYREELICVVKDNPNPDIFAMCCTGQTPVVKISTTKLEFTRLLLSQENEQILTLENVC